MKKSEIFRTFLIGSVLLHSLQLFSQSYRNRSALELENIMKGESWMGTPPDNVQWNCDGNFFWFEWNPENEILPSDYKFSLSGSSLSKMSPEEKSQRVPVSELIYNKDKSMGLFIKKGILYLYTLKTGNILKLIELNKPVSDAFFSKDEKSLYFTMENSLYKYNLNEKGIYRLAGFSDETPREKEKPGWSNEQEEWLYKDQHMLFDAVKISEEKEAFGKKNKEDQKEKKILAVPAENFRISSFGISADEKYITFTAFKYSQAGRQAEMPVYVNGTGFTESETVRSKVGYSYGEMRLGIIDMEKDSVIYISTAELPGIHDFQEFGTEQKTIIREELKPVFFSKPNWSPGMDKVIVNIRSTDNKDRWICLIELSTGKLKVLEQQHDDAWIAGPGIGWLGSAGTLGWLPDNQTIFYQSEETGFSHLYSYNLQNGTEKALTEGSFEVYNPFLSKDGKSFYFTSNEKDPGENHFYRMSVTGGKRQVLTTMPGNNEVFLSPDEKIMIVRYSASNKPWEIYKRLLNEKKGEWGEYVQITSSLTEEFKSYNWRVPENILVKASDGALVPARLYKPAPETGNKAAVIFVHGAGYLQNAHKWWSSYYREFMFHNFLADNGYVVLDMDYRGSSGYGRDWRTAIYRHMGGKDLSDHVDGAKYLVENMGVDPERIGIYGGSYGGFITLMAQFTKPGIFKAGAALRPVTDWAHYNHGYTSNILNTPFTDSIAYKRSSPIYFAGGLKDHLLICHGMVDDNVHFQDVVRLSQRLIELQKDKWELAVYPVEAHGFTEWTSWFDEYRRIYNLFEKTLLE